MSPVKSPVMSPLRNLGFVVLFFAQVFPAVTVAWQQTQRLHGRPASLAVTTRDPRDLFRGEYSTLTYDIGLLRKIAVADPARGCDLGKGTSCDLSKGRKIYVRLTPDADGIGRAAEVSFERPAADDLFIAGQLAGKATLARKGASSPDGATCDATACFSGPVTYGIETWYGAQGRPGELDAAARKAVRVMVRLDADGTPALDGVDIDGQPFARTPRLW